MARIEDAVTQIGGNIIVAGNFNSRAVKWGMRNTNPRDRQSVEMAVITDLIFANEERVAFRRPGRDGSIPYITMASESMYHRAKILGIYMQVVIISTYRIPLLQATEQRRTILPRVVEDWMH